MPRKDLSHQEKLILLQQIDEMKGISQREMSTVLGIAQSTICRLIKYRDQINNSVISGTRKRNRLSKDDEVDQALLQWFREIGSDPTITGTFLRTKAEDLAKDLGKTEFKATEGWFSRWKKRNEIYLKSSTAEIKKNTTNKLGVNNWIDLILPEMLQQFNPDDIYNCGESALYYRATPDGKLTFRSERLTVSKNAMNHVTIFACTNTTSKDRRPLLVIGKNKSPRCFKGIQKLPAEYKTNHNALMTASIFQEWIKSWDNVLIRENRKVLLILDSCVSHPNIATENIRFLFLPTDMSHVIQPMHSIIRNLKIVYRTFLLEKILMYVELERNTKFSAITLSRKINLLSALEMIAASWDSLSAGTIAHCFAKAGFPSLPNPISVNLNFYQNIMDSGQFEEFVNIDAFAQCHENEPDCVNNSEKIHIANDSESEDEVPDISSNEALSCLDKLNIFLLKNNTDKDLIKATRKLHFFISSLNSEHRKHIK